TRHNAVRLADSPNIRRYQAEYPTTALLTSGRDVGLPDGLMGNSEVGHLNLGAGRVVWQDQSFITREIEEGRFARHPAFLKAAARAREGGGRLHCMGLVSGGGVHSSPDHYRALIALAREAGVAPDRLIFHAFTDGRDTPPRSGRRWVSELAEALRGRGRIGSVCGRSSAMDRDPRWERPRAAYDMLTLGAERRAEDPVEAVEMAYARGETDEFIAPTTIERGGQPAGLIQGGDAVIMFNFRADRARQMSHAFLDADFAGFERRARPEVLWVTMTRYEESLTGAVVAYPPRPLRRILGEIVSEAGKAQLRAAETEKYAHVTYFFNGGEERPFPGEERLLVPSPKVATYDLQPEMSAPELTARVVAALAAKRHDLVVLNYANPDMVGHTGKLDAAIKAVEAADRGVGQVVPAFLAAAGPEGAVLMTADHGNCEQMWDDAAGGPHTAHTTNPVPLTLICPARPGAALRPGGRLADVAPTMLEVLGMAQPPEMEGLTLLAKGAG
ncbi:MAG: 2,3-bisphosphoglycerate-independent phosphoglycerate mutase, partial [Planctomycetes bacterium]|nr:2,3-bisphosphoglycerate-independent phosphoglycerate mutase [Planctomycetota bacterium]